MTDDKILDGTGAVGDGQTASSAAAATGAESSPGNESAGQTSTGQQPAALKRRADPYTAADYRVVVHRDHARGVFVARVPEIEHCESEAPTRNDAIARLEEELQATVANIRSSGREPPAPVEDLGAFSGELNIRIPRGLHRDLLWTARHEGVSIEQLVAELLGRGVESRVNGRGRQQQQQPSHQQHSHGHNEGGGRRDRQRGGGQQYHAIMDDRAHFMEYVRSLETGPRGSGGGGGGGRGGRGGGGRGGGGGGHR